MHRYTAALLLCITACGPSKPGGPAPSSQRLNLCVENATVAYGNIQARAGLTRFDVMPGREECKPVLVTEASVVLTAVTTGGGSQGPLHYSQRLLPGPGRCWRWRLTESPASATDLLPCDNAPRGDSASHTRDERRVPGA